MKKTLTILLAASLVCVFFASCAVTPVKSESQAESSNADVSNDAESSTENSSETESNSGTENYIIEYKGFGITPSLYRLVLANNKAYSVYIYAYYYGMDFNANPSYWDAYYSEGVTYAQKVINDTLKDCENLAVTQYLADKYGLELTDKAAVDEYIAEVKTDMGGEASFTSTLQQAGATEKDLRNYLVYHEEMKLVKDKLFASGGELEITSDEADAYLIETVAKSYAKADVLYYGYYLEDDTTKFISSGISDDETVQYFIENYIKVRYILFSSTDDKLAQKCLDGLKNGSTTFEDSLSSSNDTESECVMSPDNDYEGVRSAAASLKNGEYALANTSDGIFVFQRLEIAETDMDDEAKEYCRWLISKQLVNKTADETVIKLNDNKAELSTDEKHEFFSYYGGSTVFDADTLGQDFLTELLKVEENEYAAIIYEDGGVFIVKRTAMTDEDREKYRDEVIKDFTDKRFDEHISGMSADITRNETLIARYDVISSASVMF